MLRAADPTDAISSSTRPYSCVRPVAYQDVCRAIKRRMRSGSDGRRSGSDGGSDNFGFPSLDHNSNHLRRNSSEVIRPCEFCFVVFPDVLRCTMLGSMDYQILLWLALALAAAAVIAGNFWLHRASLTWPTTEGALTGLNVERKRGTSIPSGHYFCATFTYQFLDADGHRLSGTWYKNFSTEAEARDFAARELPVGKAVGASIHKRVLCRKPLTTTPIPPPPILRKMR
jgi:hypothetical protein